MVKKENVSIKEDKIDNLLEYLKSDFITVLQSECDNWVLESEAELKCILYTELKKFYTFIYSEVNYNRNIADLLILESSMIDIRKWEKKQQKNKSFNLDNYNTNNIVIELKYWYTPWSLSGALIWDLVALSSNQKSQHKILLYVYDRRGISNDLRDFEKLEHSNLLDLANKKANFTLKSTTIIWFVRTWKNIELIRD